jgi:hypothetical protein
MVSEIERALLPKDYAIPVTLYHYTDDNGLEGILRNQEIWATHYKCLNDTSELMSGEQHVEQVLPTIPDTLSDDLERLFAKVVCERYLDRPRVSIVETFVASFSLEADSLPQWRAYGADGHGYAIGFAFAPTANGEIGGDVLPRLHSSKWEVTGLDAR